MKKTIDIFNKMQKLDDELPEYPFKVWRILTGKPFKPSIYRDQICLSPDGDYTSIEEAREALEHVIDQLGGTVKWK